MIRKIFLSLALLFLSSSAIGATLSGTIYGGSDPLEGATVSVTVAGESESAASAVTDVNGAYAFTLADDTYNLDIVAPADSVFGSSVVNGISINGSDVIQDVILLEQAPTEFTLSGVVKNTDGVALSGVTVVTGSEYNSTDIEGNYNFSIPVGDYSNFRIEYSDWRL